MKNRLILKKIRMESGNKYINKTEKIKMDLICTTFFNRSENEID